MVSRLLAVQAQDYPGATWAIGLRAVDSTLATVEQAIAERKIVRTWPMRGTLHFVAAEDVRWMLALLPARAIARAAAREGQLGLEPADFARSRELFGRALSGGRELTRPEATALLDSGGVSTEGQRGYHILARLAQEGLLVLGPMEGKQQTFVLLDEWLPPDTAGSGASRLARDEALANLATRFFEGHGPATADDLARWADLPKREARAALASVAHTLESAEHDGARYWFAPRAAEVPAVEQYPTARPAARRPEVVLLPAFDEFMVGYANRGAQLGEFAQTYGARIGGNGLLSPTLLVNGHAVGVWKRATRARSVAVRVAPFRRLGAAERRGLAAAAGRYGRFLGLDAAVEVQATL